MEFLPNKFNALTKTGKSQWKNTSKIKQASNEKRETFISLLIVRNILIK